MAVGSIQEWVPSIQGQPISVVSCPTTLPMKAASTATGLPFCSRSQAAARRRAGTCTSSAFQSRIA